MSFTYLDSQLQKLIAEAVVLNDTSVTYTRAGNQYNPDTASTVGANTRVRRSVVVAGQTLQFDLLEHNHSNLATTLSTGTYTMATTIRHTVWWDGAAGDYTVTISASGTVSAKSVTADGRNYVTISGHTANDTVTATRSGGPTNTHLQVEPWPHPTSKIALSGSRSSAAFKSSITLGATGTLVAVVNPYGWSNDQGPGTNWHLYRGTSGATNVIWRTRSSSFSNCSYVLRGWTGAAGSAQQRDNFRDGQYRVTHQSWTQADAINCGASSWLFREWFDAGSSVGSVVSATLPFLELSSGLDIGCWTVGGGLHINGWILVLQYTRVLTQDELNILADAFEQPSGHQKFIVGWGDSEMIHQGTNNDGVLDLLFNTHFTYTHLFNGAVGGETSAQILTRFQAASHMWPGVTVIWSNNSPVLSDIQAMVNALGHHNYVVISALNPSTSPSGSAGYNATIAFNNSLASAFGSRYWDGRAYMITQNVSPGDNTDTANDVIGTSMRGDAIHLNANGRTIFSAQLAVVLRSLGYLT